MRIAIYAIAKNEAAHVARFMSAAADADFVVIADTGSTDDTVELAESLGASVYSISIQPWRFDKARDAALALVPADVDVCISVDLDEVMQPGWRQAVEAAWKPGTTRLKYRFDFGGGVIYACEKAHSRHGYFWKYPIHEYISPVTGFEQVLAETDACLTAHLPDRTKSRGQYMPMLELAVREDPSCSRSQFYLARELFYHSRWVECVDAFEKFLDMPGATWSVERCYARRCVGRALISMGKPASGISQLHLSAMESPKSRDSWVALAQANHDQKNWEQCRQAAERALCIAEPTYEFTADQDAWGSRPYDLAALACWNLGDKAAALEYGTQAHLLSPDDARLANNLKFYSS
jgi:tetratricopeptide (TPR) repeat protein